MGYIEEEVRAIFEIIGETKFVKEKGFLEKYFALLSILYFGITSLLIWWVADICYFSHWINDRGSSVMVMLFVVGCLWGIAIISHNRKLNKNKLNQLLFEVETEIGSGEFKFVAKIMNFSIPALQFVVKRIQRGIEHRDDYGGLFIGSLYKIGTLPLLVTLLIAARQLNASVSGSHDWLVLIFNAIAPMYVAVCIGIGIFYSYAQNAKRLILLINYAIWQKELAGGAKTIDTLPRAGRAVFGS